MVDNSILIRQEWQDRIFATDKTIDHLQGPINDLMITPASNFIGKLTNEIQLTARKLSIDFSREMSSEEIDTFAANFGISRVQGDRARGIVFFKLATPQREELVFPRGIRVSTSDGKYGYPTINEVTITLQQLPTYFNAATQLYEIPMEVEAEDIGPNFRTAPFTVTNVESSNVSFRIVGVENRTEITGGTLAETDAKLIHAIKQRSTLKERGIPQGLLDTIRSITGNNATDVKLVSVNTGKAIKSIYLLGKKLAQTEEIFEISSASKNEFTFSVSSIHFISQVTLNGQQLDNFAWNFDKQYQTLYIESSLLLDDSILRVVYSYNSIVTDIEAYLSNNDTNLFGTSFIVSEGRLVPLQIAIQLQLQATFKFLNIEPHVRRVVLAMFNPTTFVASVYREKLIETIKAEVAGVIGVSVNIFTRLSDSEGQVEVIEFAETETPSLSSENLSIR